MPPARRDDAEVTRWALAARTGDRAAAAAFVRATQVDVYRFLSHSIDASAEDIEDLRQETYLRALRSLPGFEARSSARTWLFAIARRVAADHVRAAVRSPRTAVTDDWEAAADGVRRPGVPQLDDAVVLRRLLQALPPDRREAFVATQILGLSYAEAARLCDCPVGTIRSRVSRAREDLVTALRADRAPDRPRRSARG